MKEVLIFEKIIFKEIAIMYGKGEFVTIRLVFVLFPLKEKVYPIYGQDLQIPMKWLWHN